MRVPGDAGRVRGAALVEVAELGVQTTRFGTLPYGPWMTRALMPLHAGFIGLNRLMVPVLDSWVGPWFSTDAAGHLLVLRTRGRRTGRTRDAPLGYVIRDGAILVTAGFGPRTAWYRNLIDDPNVSVVLPGGTFRAVAEPVTDPEAYADGFRALIDGLGVVGRLTVGDLHQATPARLAELRAGLPLVRIRPVSFEAGPPGIPAAAWLGLAVTVLGAAGVGWLAGRSRRFESP
jgi:deazaflavin-dependent oxidoreductase (nitroreductase family)